MLQVKNLSPGMFDLLCSLKLQGNLASKALLLFSVTTD
jgi:hypothetical protein